MKKRCADCRFFNLKTNVCRLKDCLKGDNDWCGGFISITEDIFNTLTDDEFDACVDMVARMRAERQKEEAIQQVKNKISFEISDGISQIGLENVKRIVRELNRELRDLN